MPVLELLEIMYKYWLVVENSLNDAGDSGRARKSSVTKRLQWQGVIYSFTRQQECAASAGLVVGQRGTSLRSTVKTSIELALGLGLCLLGLDWPSSDGLGRG